MRGARLFSSIKMSMTNRVNSRIVDDKIICFMCVCANVSHFYLGIFSLRIFCLYKCPLKLSIKCLLYYCLVITLWKCEYCLIWALNKSVLFGSNSLKVSVLCDMNSEKTFFYSLIWKEVSENVSIAWYSDTLDCQ